MINIAGNHIVNIIIINSKTKNDTDATINGIFILSNALFVFLEL